MAGGELVIDALVTADSPAEGELVGLTIGLPNGRKLMDHALFRPQRPENARSLLSASSTGVLGVLGRQPFGEYAEAVSGFLDGASVLRGPHVARDIAFLEAQGVRISSGLRDRSLRRAARDGLLAVS